ncbi:MAG: biofilm PGA synthesis N-glycosyltransferase PgaC [Lentimonas sp.]|jgi:biofilm PGA synthesis N-glycosyltransferase PgaC
MIIIVGIYGIIVFVLRRRELFFKLSSSLEIQTDNLFHIDELTLIVPFRNEGQNIDALIQSIEESKILPRHIIFVSDHSNEKTVDRIKLLSKQINYKILQLPIESAGKKKAIDLGVKKCDTKYVLTMDADVWFDKHYFAELGAQKLTDFNILPVNMVGNSLIDGFFAMEYNFQRRGGVLIGQIMKPFVCSGANLCFTKSLYNDFSDVRTDWNVASGDDMFFLDFVLKNCARKIQIIESINVEVKTAAYNSISKSLAQRRRWFGKTALLKNPLAAKIGIAVLITQLAYYGTAFNLIITGHAGEALLLLIIKAFLDYFLIGKGIIKPRKWPMIVVFEFLFPVYLLTFFLTVNRSFEWKGRKLKSPPNDGLW